MEEIFKDNFQKNKTVYTQSKVSKMNFNKAVNK